MSMTLEAVYEDGALRLARPLPLPNHEHVTVTIETGDDVIAALVKASGGPEEPEPHPIGFDVMNLVIENRLPIRICRSSDFSDAILPNGKLRLEN